MSATPDNETKLSPGMAIEMHGVNSYGPSRRAYSRAELADGLKNWMIELWGDSPKNLSPEQRDQWYRDNGLIHLFICDHFPAENE